MFSWARPSQSIRVATCYPSVEALYEVPDAALVGANRVAAIGTVAQHSEIDVGGAAVHAAVSCLLAALVNVTRRMTEIVVFNPAR